jgi:hypothetical protein
MALRISVLSSGAILLEGQPVGLADLDAALKTAKETSGSVWYYREGVHAEPPPLARTVLELVVKWKLPISLSSKPDFSDYVDPRTGQSHPRAQTGPAAATAPNRLEPRMPDVDQQRNVEAILATAWTTAADENGRGGIAILRPDRSLLLMPRLPQSAELDALAKNMERVISSAVKRNIAVIADTSFAETGQSAVPSLAHVNQTVPFFGMLVGLSSIGHCVWMFEGHPSALAAGCRDADVLIVDSAMARFLPAGWQDTAAGTMRNPNILLHDRQTFKLRAVRKVGAGANLEFQL